MAVIGTQRQREGDAVQAAVAGNEGRQLMFNC